MWPSGRMPFVITKDGSRIDLTIHDNIPYIDLGTIECFPHDCIYHQEFDDFLKMVMTVRMIQMLSK